MRRISAIYRHPVKGLGEESLASVALAPGQHMPFDRLWALATAGGDWDPERRDWVRRRHFVNTAMSPELARIATSLSDGLLTVSHPAAQPLTVDPENPAEAALLAAWLEGIAGASQPGPYRIARLPQGALTDVPDAHLSILSDRSLAVLSQQAGRTLERRRFRGNIWVEGLDPWEEFDWVGREISLGPLRVKVTARIDRCAAPSASPETGRRDVPVTEVLRGRWDHVDFGVYATVIEGGTLGLGDEVRA